MNNNYIPKTVKELESWMQENCYNFDKYSINGNPVYEGYGIDNLGGLFVWYYTERGEKDTVKYGQSEAEIIEYAFNQIKRDKWAKTHCIGFTISKDEKQELEIILKDLSVEFFQDEIPYYGLGNPVYRTFVLGCDINKTIHLKSQYYKSKY